MTDQLTLQDVFNNAVRGIYKQGGPAYDHALNACVYRLQVPGGEPWKCGIGQSIPDDIYTQDLEGLGIQKMVWPDTDEEFSDIADLFDGIDGRALGELQSVHDNAASRDNEKPGHPMYAPFMEEFLSTSLVYSYKHDLTWPSDVPRPD